MKFSTGIAIFFLAIIALVAEIFLYFIFGLSLAFSGANKFAITGMASFFFWVMIMTAVSAIAAPVAGIVQNLSKKETTGMPVFLSIIGLVGFGSAALLVFNYSLNLKSSGALSAAYGVPTSNNSWSVSDIASPMDSEKTTVLRLEAESEVKAWVGSVQPVLVIQCKPKQTDVYVIHNTTLQYEYGSYNQRSVRVKIDDQAVSKQRWRDSSDDNALFAPKSGELLNQMAKAKTLLFEFTPFKASPVTARFNVAGLGQRLDVLKTKCHMR